MLGNKVPVSRFTDASAGLYLGDLAAVNPAALSRHEQRKETACLHFVLGKVIRVQAEVSIAVHVVNVGPHDLQGDVSCPVPGYHLT